MSFATYARQVRDPGRGLHWRRINLRRCIDLLARRTGEPFADVYRRYAAAYPFESDPTDAAQLAALAAVEAERGRLLAAEQAATRKQGRSGGGADS